MSLAKEVMEKVFPPGSPPEYMQVKPDDDGVVLTIDLGLDPVEAENRLQEVSQLKLDDVDVHLVEVDGPPSLPWRQYTRYFLSMLLEKRFRNIAVPERHLDTVRGVMYEYVMENLQSTPGVNPIRILNTTVMLRNVINTSPLTSRVLSLSSSLDPELKFLAASLVSFQERRYIPKPLRRLVCNLAKVVRRNTRSEKYKRNRSAPSGHRSPTQKETVTLPSDNEDSSSVGKEFQELDSDDTNKDIDTSPRPLASGDDDSLEVEFKPDHTSGIHVAGTSKYDIAEDAPASFICYICKKRSHVSKPTTDALKQYPRLCPTCADTNWTMRTARVDLTGYYAVVTGGRSKIGYETVLKLLRNGCHVITTTRFPNDAAKRFSSEEDYLGWSRRLQIYPLDLKDVAGIYKFVDHLKRTVPHLDILINNAAQTLHRPYTFYEHLLEHERLPGESLPAQQGELLVSPVPLNYSNVTQSLMAATTGQTTDVIANDCAPSLTKKRKHPVTPIEDDMNKRPKVEPSVVDAVENVVHGNFPVGCVDEFGQQLDLSRSNSWRSVMEEVPISELVEVLMVNTIAPYILNKEIKSILVTSPHQRRFIVNVSAMEGQFNRSSKTKYHPHTNMAKAALNMMTRTGALGYLDDRIFMTAVDTGWVTDERPFAQAAHEMKKGFVLPLDCVDGAARIVHPVFAGVTNKENPYYAVFLKNYSPYPW